MNAWTTNQTWKLDLHATSVFRSWFVRLWAYTHWMALLLAAFGLTRVQSEAQVNDLAGVIPVSSEKRLISHLLDKYATQGKMGRPVSNNMDNLTVFFGLSLIQILDVDESSHVLKTSMWYQYEWTDLLLQWEPAQHDNINSVRLPSCHIWLPDINLYNFADDRLSEQRDALVVVSNTGNIMWMPQAILRSSCSFDTKFFPFDVQICWLKFGSWTYSGKTMNIELASQHSLDLSDYVMSNEWDIVGNTATRQVKYYTCCHDSFPDLTFKLTLKRKTAFYTFILILPCTLLSLLTLIIFWVPPESPAKLQLGMSVFVAFFFLLLVLADFTPRASASIPLIGAYFCLSMTMITMSTMLACVVANMYFRGVLVNRAPSWMRCCIVYGLAKLLNLDTPQPRAHHDRNKDDDLAGTQITRENHSNSDTEFQMVEVRLLEKGGYAQTVVPQEVIDVSERDCGYDSVPERETSTILLEDVRRIKDLMLKNRDERRHTEELNAYLREWRVIACVTDRLFFVFYVTVNVITVAILFCGS